MKSIRLISFENASIRGSSAVLHASILAQLIRDRISEEFEVTDHQLLLAVRAVAFAAQQMFWPEMHNKATLAAIKLGFNGNIARSAFPSAHSAAEGVCGVLLARMSYVFDRSFSEGDALRAWQLRDIARHFLKRFTPDLPHGKFTDNTIELRPVRDAFSTDLYELGFDVSLAASIERERALIVEEICANEDIPEATIKVSSFWYHARIAYLLFRKILWIIPPYSFDQLSKSNCELCDQSIVAIRKNAGEAIRLAQGNGTDQSNVADWLRDKLTLVDAIAGFICALQKGDATAEQAESLLAFTDADYSIGTMIDFGMRHPEIANAMLLGNEISETTQDQNESQRPVQPGPLRRNSGVVTKIIAALMKHHQYADDSCLNPEPIGVKQLARSLDVAPSSVSEFFSNKFKGHQQYKACCLNTTKLITALKMLNGDYAPYILMGSKPPNEKEWDEE